MGLPVTQYAQAGEVNIAYQVVGDGPVDLVWAYGLASNIDVLWDEPSLAAFFRRLSELARLIIFDRRGCGLSDRHGTTIAPTIEERIEDVLAVLDSVGSDRASFFGVSEGGAFAAAFAAAHPERTASVITFGTGVPFVEDPMSGLTEEMMDAFTEGMAQTWGVGDGTDAVRWWAPSMEGDEQFARWMVKFAQHSVSRGAIRPLLSALRAYDLEAILPAVRVPALVLHRTGDRLVPVSFGRYLASRIPEARFVELEGEDHLPFVGDTETVLAEVQQLLVGSRPPVARDRRLLTLVFTDIVDSTSRLSDLGDGAWREVLRAHDRDVRAHISRFGGEEVKHLGDGVLASFGGPARAIHAARGIVEAAERLGLAVRVGIHTGECERIDADLSGIAVHVASRILEQADPGQILVSSTVRDLVAGSGIRFGEERAVHLPGVPGARTLLPVFRHGAAPETVRRTAIERTNLVRRDGEYWTIGYQGSVVALRDTKGLRDLARLLAEPGREVHVLDLQAPGPVGSVTSAALAGEAGLHAARAGDPVIDQRARVQYQHRVRELEADIDDAQARGDGEAAATASEELDALIAQLTAAYGLGGRSRRSPDHIERARKAVSRRLRDALGRVAAAHPALGRHLDASIRTGVFCSYQPEQPIEWSVEPRPG